MTQNKFPSTLTNYLHIYLTHHGLFSFVGDVMNVQRGCQYSLLSRAGHFYAIRLMQSGWVQICPEEVYCMSFSQFSCLLYTLLSTRIKKAKTYIYKKKCWLIFTGIEVKWLWALWLQVALQVVFANFWGLSVVCFSIIHCEKLMYHKLLKTFNLSSRAEMV